MFDPSSASRADFHNLYRSSEDLAMFSDLLAIQPHVNEIMSSVTSTIAPMLSGLAVVSVFRHITTLIRTTAARVTGREWLAFRVSSRVG